MKISFPGQTAKGRQLKSPDFTLSVEVSTQSYAKYGADYMVGTMAVPVPAMER